MSAMQSEAHRDNQTIGNSNEQSISTCPNCNALMPREMRFCRACGCRLGEGVEEYTETVRFERAPETSRNRKSRTPWAMPPLSSPFDRKEFKTMANRIHAQTVKSMTTGLGQWQVRQACKRVPRWLIWVIVPIMLASMMGGFKSGSNSARKNREGSFIGSHFKSADGGALIQDVSPPGSAADKAGLVGGDLVINFDGKSIKNDGELRSILGSTPIGKTVEVVYIRDGETKTTRLTTVSEKDNEKLAEAFSDRPEGNGFLGVAGDKFERVRIPEKNIYGVRVNRVFKNDPGYIAGLRDGDIVIEFDGVPIRTIEEFNKRIDRALPDSVVKVVVMRGAERLEIPIKMGEE